jgi:16S rRNA C967 or C1407 C5-methylase (RsmB/RsmF family)/NOL1/NOP2/fmu family ribosome biogenesis protein
LQTKLPDKLIISLRKINGFDQEAFEKVHQSNEQITSIRFNPLKHLSRVIGKSAAEKLHSHQVLFPGKERIPWSSFGYYLPERPSFTLEPLFHAGVFYVQEASSMFLEQALKHTVDLTKSLRILDLCAAPGGKSTLIQSIISADSLLVSNEVIRSRVNMLAENMIKWGSVNTVVTNNDPKDIGKLRNYFDVMVVDAPCSGSGLFRKEPEAVKEWSEETLHLCAGRQQRILADAMPALKQNGVLIYSTCSYSQEENEDILDWIMETMKVESLPIHTDPEWNIVETLSDRYKGNGYRFYPGKVRGEGFFIAAFRKLDGDSFDIPSGHKTIFERPGKRDEIIARKWIGPAPGLSLVKMENLILAIPTGLVGDMHFLRPALRIRKAGVCLGKITHTELLPDHELAMSTLIDPKTDSVALSKDDALAYLRKEELKTDGWLKGWCLVRYQDQNLGWLKILQKRANNYYPSAWRIVMRK